MEIYQATIRINTATRELTGELLGLGQTQWKSQSGAENIESNVQILRDNPNIPNSQVDKIEEMAKKHDTNLGQ